MDAGDGKRYPTIAERLRAATRLLGPVTDTSRLDAEILLAHALGTTRSKLIARLNERIDAPEFDALLARRLDYEPLAYILGEWEFFSLAFKVVPPLLVPRPETEHLVEAVLDFIGQEPARVLEIGTGTGCVSVAIAHNAPEARITATDINSLALETARENAEHHNVADRIEFIHADLFENLNGPFDVVCSNPPYIEEEAWPDLSSVIRLHEDPRALLAGHDGLDVIRKIVTGARTLLRLGGLLAFEIGMGQNEASEKLLLEACYSSIAFRKDLAGINRIATAIFP